VHVLILALESHVKREFKKLYIAYKVDTNFVDEAIQKSGLRMTVNMKFIDVIDPKGICKDITGIGSRGNGDVNVFLGSLGDLDDIMDIIAQAFRKQEREY
jgi:predicted transport protein